MTALMVDPQPLVAHALVVDDHTFMRRAIRNCLETLDVPRITEAERLVDAIRIIQEDPPQLCVLDLHLPDGRGLDLLNHLRTVSCQMVVAFTSADDAYTVRSAYAAGISGYVLKSATQEAVVDGLRTVMSGRVYADPTVAVLLAQGVRDAPLADITSLTRRELTVLELIAAGRSNGEAALELDMSPLSVKSHLARIGRKLGTGDRTQMVAIATKAGLLR